MYRKFGEELMNIRVKRNMSIKDVSNITQYSEKRIRELEKNNGLPSLDLLNQLSSCYKANLIVYFSATEYNLPPEVLHIFFEFRRVIEKYDVETLQSLIKAHCEKDYFKEGEGLKIILYSKGLCFAKEGDFKNACDVYLEALTIDNVDINNILNDNIYYSYTTLSILVSLGCSLYIQGDTEIGLKIVDNLDTIFRNQYFNDQSLFLYNKDIIIRMYIVNSNNLAVMYNRLGIFDKGLERIDLAISFCKENYKISVLLDLYSTKLEILYKKEDYDDAKTLAQTILVTSKLLDEDMYNKYKSSIKLNCPKLNI